MSPTPERRQISNNSPVCGIFAVDIHDFIILVAMAVIPGMAPTKFGTGTVVAVQQRPDDIELSVAFENAGVKRLLQSFAPLTPA